MLKISDRDWMPFDITGDSGLFQLAATKSGIDKNKLNCTPGKFPYITRSDSNNGANMFVTDCQQMKFKHDNANVITIGLDTQTCFYQPSPFYTGQNIQVLSNNILNQYSALFVCTALKQQLKKFHWGGNGATLGRLYRTKILLPVDISGNPDFKFMENFVKERQREKLNRYLAYAEEEFLQIKSSMASKQVEKLSNVHWEPFVIGEIFKTLVAGKSGGRNHFVEDWNTGTAYIGATNKNNGVLSFVKFDADKTQPGNAIGFIKNGNGSAGYSIYKQEAFISTSDVIFGYADWLNKYTGLFITTCSDMSQTKYSHGYKWTKDRLERSTIMLPISDDGSPDYQYMEQYIRAQQSEKLGQYIAFAKSRVADMA